MSYSNDLSEFTETRGALMEEAPELEQFAGFSHSAEATDAIDHRTKELVSLAIGVVVRWSWVADPR